MPGHPSVTPTASGIAPSPDSSSNLGLSLPIINISPYLRDPDSSPSQLEARQAVASALHRACSDYGFFYLDISAYVDPRDPLELTELAREFFGSPQEVKDRISIANQDYARGYQRLKENVTMGKADNHEGIDWYRPVDDPDKTKPLWGENQWPELPGFKDKFEAWVQKMKALGLILMEAMAHGLGMTEDEWQNLRAQVDDSFWVMRAIGYPPLPDDHDGFSCGAHKDYGCLTFLYADPTPNALQVFLRGRTVTAEDEGEDEGVKRKEEEGAADVSMLPEEQGGEEGVWINADPIPGCVVCNIGEMWEIWTNGLYKSTLHRVIHRSANYRVSIPFFFEPNLDAVVEPLAAALRLQDKDPSRGGAQEDEKKYERVVYGEFLKAKVGNNFAASEEGGEKKGRY